ncbi:MAG TPA: DUF2997 domain-containing protein [Polyangia bacterium]|nr:DUF2997 domain-containing protein [Polyangia bacterium]
MAGAERKELEITISPDGEVSVQVKCIKGQSCVDETKFLEDALGGKVESRELTPEYYEQPVGGAANTTRQK